MTVSRNDAPPPEVRWGVGCLVGGAALVGSLLLLIVLAFLLNLPGWVQIALGTLLPLGSVLLGWLVATALGQRDRDRLEAERLRGPRPLA